MAWWSWCVLVTGAAIPSMTLAQIDTVTARTTLRLWHELYVEKKLAHDFQDVFDPGDGDECFYVAGIVGDEIRAIAQCQLAADRDDVSLVSLAESLPLLSMRRVAHSPHGAPLGDAFVKRVAEGRVAIDDTLRSKQPRWYVAYSFYTTN